MRRSSFIRNSAGVPVSHDGARGTPERAGDRRSDPSLSPVLDPAPGGQHPAGAGSGQVEPCRAPARNAPVPGGSGSQGNPHAGAREAPGGRTAGPDVPAPGPAQASPPEQRGEGGARGEGPGDATPVTGPVPAEASAPVPGGPVADRGGGARGDSSVGGTPSPLEPGGAARVDAAAPPAPLPGLRGEDFRKALRAAQSQQARERRTGRGQYTPKRAGDAYGAGKNRRMPGGDGAP